MNTRKRAAITQTSSKEGGTFTKLPICVLINILSLLPIRSLLSCRCVCKVWLNLISDPYFAKLHLERSPISILIKTRPPKRPPRKLHLAQIEQDHATPFVITKFRFNAKNNLPNSDFEVVNSCNGLLCLSGSKDKHPIYICNPILGDYITISLPNNIDRCSKSFGLGFSVKTNEYKVIQTFVPRIESGPIHSCNMAEIYTIGTGEWRSLGNVSYSMASLRFNSFLNGALHWICYPHDSLDFIQSFDFESERFQSLPPPPQCDSVLEMASMNPFVLGVLDGCLSLSDSFAGRRQFDIWVMKEYGVKESWTRLYVIENLYCRGRYEPIIVLKSGEILMLCDDDNVETKNLRLTDIFLTLGKFHAIGYTPCFVSLNSVAKGDDLTSSSY